jgi:hypothetical protein
MSALQCVEGEHPIPPAGTGEPFSLFGEKRGAGSNNEHVVGDRRAVGQVDSVGLDLDSVHLVQTELDAGAELRAA